MEIQILDKLFIRHNEIENSRQSIWFLHGFADSGVAYKEVFDSPLVDEYNLYVLDLPGFGGSPLYPAYSSIQKQAELLSNIIRKESSKQGKVNIVAHSLGGLIGTWICQSLQEKINYYFSIEGNLTEADSYFSSKPLQFETGEAFALAFEKEIFELAKSQDRFKRYYASLRLADPEAMRNWGFSSQVAIQGNTCGHEFNELTCNKIYIWGEVDTPQETQDFIETHYIPNRLYTGIGHWHMYENSAVLYRDMNEWIQGNE